MKKIRRLLAVILICVFCVGVCPLASAAEPLPGSTDLYLLSENNSDGQAKLLGKTVTVEGIVTVASGVWHDQVNYFSIVTPRDSYRFGGGTLVYSPGNATQYKVGDRVVVRCQTLIPSLPPRCMRKWNWTRDSALRECRCVCWER